MGIPLATYGPYIPNMPKPGLPLHKNWMLGIVDFDLTAIAKCGHTPKNVSRALHRLIHRSGRALPVNVTSVSTPIRILKGKPRVQTCNFPVLLLSSWGKQILESGGEMLLGGRNLDDAGYKSMFATFWERFKYFRPDLDLYTRDFDLATCIPMAYHGDEGRGKLKRPVMVLAYQPVINYKGENFISSSGNPGCIVCDDAISF